MIEREYCLAIPKLNHKLQVISAFRPHGYRMTGEGNSCSDFLRVLRKTQPFLAVMDLSLQGNVWETAAIIEEEGLSAVLLLTEGGASSGSWITDYSFATLSYPVNSLVLSTTAEVLCLEFFRKRKLAAEVRELRSKLQNRIIMEKAKGVVMSELGVDEQRAYRFLQKASMEMRRPLKDMAEAVINKGIKCIYREINN